MRTRRALWLLVIPVLLLGVIGLLAIRQGNGVRSGITVVVDNAGEFEPDFAATLGAAVPPEWVVPGGASSRYEVHVTVSQRTSVCQYINTNDIRLEKYDIEASIIDPVSGEHLATQSFQAPSLTCPTRRGEPTTSYPRNSELQEWLIATLSGQNDLSTLLRPVLVLPIEGVNDYQVRPDGEQILVQAGIGLRLLDPTTGAVTAVVDYDESYDIPFYSPDGRFFAADAFSQPLRVWDSETGAVRFVLGSTKYPEFAPAFSPDGRLLASVNDANEVHVWDADTGLLLCAVSGLEEIIFIEFSPDGRVVVAYNRLGEHLAWNVQTGEVVPEVVRYQTLNPDRSLALNWESGDKIVNLLDSASGETLAALTGHSEAVIEADFSPDGHMIVTGALDQTTRLWDVATGQELRRWNHDYSPVPYLSPDGRLLVTRCSSGCLQLEVWNVQTGERVGALPHPVGIFWVQFLEDGQRLLTVDYEQTVRLWDIGGLYAALE